MQTNEVMEDDIDEPIFNKTFDTLVTCWIFNTLLDLDANFDYFDFYRCHFDHFDYIDFNHLDFDHFEFGNFAFKTLITLILIHIFFIILISFI